MNTVFYPTKRTFLQYDHDHYLLYLREESAEFTPAMVEPTEGEDPGVNPEPVKGFNYTGTEEDGGTLIKASVASYDAFTSGLIRLRYSADEVEAINTNKILALDNKKHERAAEFTERFNEFQEYREECKEHAKAVLNL